MPLRYSEGDGVAVLTLDRPEVLNAFDDELGRQALEAVRRAAEDELVRCIVVTGAGRAFCSGEDVGALASAYDQGRAPELGRVLTERYNPLIRAVVTAPKPVVAALNGVAAGAGASLALACDARIASEHAKLVLAFANVGLVPDSGALWFLTRMTGAAKAWQLAVTGEPLGAQEALRLGVVHAVASAADFDAAWRALASSLAAGPTQAYALTKKLILGAMERSLDEQLDLEVEAQARAGKTRDHLEGVRAFLAKRAARFEGR